MGAPAIKGRSFFDQYVGTCFINACIKTTSAYLSTPPVESDHNIAADLSVPYEAGAYLEFVADKTPVQFTLAFDRKCAVALYNQMLGESRAEIDDDILDAMGELSNMIYGAAKAPLVDQGHSFSQARPKAITNIDSILKGKKSLIIRFIVDGGSSGFGLILSV
jgi:chemotaxis protein CheX